MAYDPHPEPAIVREARAWINTPYRHRHARKNFGCDALGLVLGVAGLGHLIHKAPAYYPDWGVRDHNLLTAACKLTGGRMFDQRYFKLNAPPVGAILGFEMASGAGPKHLAIFTGDHLIHAYWGRAVVESRYADWWRNLCVGGFTLGALPNVHVTAPLPPLSGPTQGGLYA